LEPEVDPTKPTQGFLERDSDERDFYRPTAECLRAVDAVLSQG